MTKVATITLNPAMDLVGRVGEIEVGEVNTVETLGLYPAGKGINVAKVLADLKVQSTVTGFLGADNKGDFEAEFAKYGIEDKFARVAGKTRVNIKVTQEDGEVTDLNFQGFTVTPADWQAFVQQTLEQLKGFDYVAVCGSLPRGVELADFKAWLEQLNALGCKVIFDSSNKALEVGLQANPWLIKPNWRELEVLTQTKFDSIEQVLAAARQLNAQGITNVVVSMGAKGSLWVTKDFVYQAQPPKITNVVSTVGAGDSMVAGFIYSLVNNLDPEQTLRFASAISAYAVTQGNVGVESLETLDPFLAQVTVSKIA
ncbi:1-phosphofructokinase [Psittacicella melopsittaci]|uniref:Phosphofructokinase n=1 Tax=Psittacicella melopsittaci TaxID=2028576 RepID=A0A3A1Y5V2_9GAMM|nr:1-phosphofructokinase [Psittacicella melopsittaci]RIY32656.1 1-phosphofructokinase [Psittacicella melopsittaci]